MLQKLFTFKSQFSLFQYLQVKRKKVTLKYQVAVVVCFCNFKFLNLYNLDFKLSYKHVY